MPSVINEVIGEITETITTIDYEFIEDDNELIATFGVGASEVIGTVEDGIIGEQGEQGEQGKSPYDIAVENGFIGTEVEWLDSLKGEKGDIGNVDISEEDGNIIERKPDGLFVSPMVTWAQNSW